MRQVLWRLFWGVLLFTAGMAIGAMGYALLSPPKAPANPSDCLRNGWTFQVEGNVGYTSHVPALDECPEL